MCVGILDRQAFGRCGSKQPRIGRHEDQRCKTRDLEATARHLGHSKLETTRIYAKWRDRQRPPSRDRPLVRPLPSRYHYAWSCMAKDVRRPPM